jgi:phage shock protein A
VSFFRRLGRLFSQEARAAVGRIENPAQSVEDAYQEHLALLQDVREQLAQVLTAQKKLEMQAAAIERTRDRYRQEALVAVQAQDDVRARRAIGRTSAYDIQLDDLRNEIAAVHESFLKIENAGEDLRVRTETIRHQKEIVAARVATARASITAHSALGGLGPEMESINGLLADAQSRTQDLQARAAAIEELVERGTFDQPGPAAADDVARRIREAVSPDAIEAQLTSLKQKMLSE